MSKTMTGTSTHWIWSGMKQRCSNPKVARYKYYGGRGIKVCDRWQTFANFYADMGERPEGTSIDRIDSNGDYESGNCRWATIIEQANTRRSVRRYEGKTTREWSTEFGIQQRTMKSYITRHGFEQAIKFYRGLL